jgi:cardiolipin synthase
MKLPQIPKLNNPPGRWHLPVNLAALTTTLYHTYRAPIKTDYKLSEAPDPASSGFLRAIEAATNTPHTTGNRLQLLINGDQIFPSMLEAIEAAQHTINFLTYVYWRGPIAQRFADSLSKKARDGVECNLLLDAIGAEKIDHKMIVQMKEAGVRVIRFRPLSWTNLSRLDNRTHRKVLVVDGKVGFTGGVGIAQEWTGHAQDPKHWRETHIRVEGPAVRGLQGAFIENWLEATGQFLVGETYLPELQPFASGVPAQVTRSGAGKGDSNMEMLFLLALAAARRRIWLTTAYFSPRPLFLEILIAAAQKGVDVRILLPGPYSNQLVAREAGRTTYSLLLGAGVQIYEYQPTMMHAKTLTIDGIWSSVGSTNFDNRSFALNDEVNLSVQDVALATELDNQFEMDLARSKVIKAVEWKQRSAIERVAELAGSTAWREL